MPATKQYTEFKLQNRVKVNLYLNLVLWFFVIAGPAIALGVHAGFFYGISYQTCIRISAFVVALSAVHLVLRKRFPTSIATCLFALTALDALLVYMAFSHVRIYLTWFLVPMLSLLFCDRFLYFYSVGLNYVLMMLTTELIAPYQMQFQTLHGSTKAYFADILGGFTIETVIMAVSGYMILKLTEAYFSKLYRQNALIREHERSMKEKMDILDSMAEIYDKVNLIDFLENTEMSLRDAEQKKHGIDMSAQTHTLMNQKLKNQVLPEQLEDFLTFTNITTVRRRLTNKKLISADFIDVASGWFRAQYITVDAAPDGAPNIVIYTVRNVDEEKRREEHLLRISMTDEMTRLFNRRCYEEDIAVYHTNGLPADFVLFSVDVNGLKTANDTKGHAAGDELITAAADCLTRAIGSSGEAYRTGGDEFMAIVHTNAPEEIRSRILTKAADWQGTYIETVSLSVGYAAAKDHPGQTLDALAKIADADMYAEKEKYYAETGLDRR